MPISVAIRRILAYNGSRMIDRIEQIDRRLRDLNNKIVRLNKIIVACEDCIPLDTTKVNAQKWLRASEDEKAGLEWDRADLVAQMRQTSRRTIVAVFA